MVIFKLLRCDEDAQRLLGFAKNQSRRLIASGIRTFTRNWLVDGITISARSVEFGNDEIVKLTLGGAAELAIFNRLYNWPAIAGAVNFVLQSDVEDVPLNRRITVEPSYITPLGDALQFVGRAADFPLSYQVAGTSTPAMFITLRALAEQGHWLLRQVLAQSIAAIYVDRLPGDPGELEDPPPAPPVVTTAELEAMTGEEQDAYFEQLDYWRPLLVIDQDECLVSQPAVVGDDFYLLLGSFLGHDPPSGMPVMEYFRGICLRISTLEAVNITLVNGITADVSSYGAMTSEQLAAVKIFAVDEYERSIGGSTGGLGLVSQLVTPRVSSPFCLSYEFSEAWIYVNDSTDLPTPGAPFPTHTEQEAKHYVLEHRLGTSGEVEVTTLDKAPFSGGAGWAVETDPGSNFVISADPISCALTFYSGAELVRVGEYSYTGQVTTVVSGFGGTTPGSATRAQAIPFYSGIVGHVDEYFPEFGLIRSGTTIINDLDARPYSLTLDSAGPDSDISKHAPGPVSYTHSAFFAAGDDRTENMEGNTFGLVGGDAFTSFIGNMTPRRSGLPTRTINGFRNVQLAGDRMGGVVWFRAGLASGVFLFVVPGELVPHEPDAERAKDCAKYQNVYFKRDGFRAAVLGAGGVVVTPAQADYEPLDDILDRIEDRTIVVLNNFATPELYPWLVPAMLGVIL